MKQKKSSPMRLFWLLLLSALASLASGSEDHPIAYCENLLLPRVAHTLDYREGAGLSVVMIGDSTVRDFTVASNLGMFLQLLTRNQRNPFLNTDPRKGIASVFQRLAQRYPVRAFEVARAGATVGPPQALVRRWFQRFADVKVFAEQVDEVLAETQVPDIILSWIGHNNLDFITEAGSAESPEALDAACARIRENFSREYRRQLLRLLEGVRADGRRHAIVVYGLVNPAATQAARAQAREQKLAAPGLFPYFQKSEMRFPPLKIEQAERLVELSRTLSADLRQLVQELREAELGGDSKVGLFYSDATATMPLDQVSHLSADDAWHASEQGMNVVAEALFLGLTPALAHIGAR